MVTVIISYLLKPMMWRQWPTLSASTSARNSNTLRTELDRELSIHTPRAVQI